MDTTPNISNSIPTGKEDHLFLHSFCSRWQGAQSYQFMRQPALATIRRNRCHHNGGINLLPLPVHPFFPLLRIKFSMTSTFLISPLRFSCNSFFSLNRDSFSPILLNEISTSSGLLTLEFLLISPFGQFQF